MQIWQEIDRFLNILGGSVTEHPAVEGFFSYEVVE